MMKHLVLALSAAALLAAAASGSPLERGNPGSLLLFPEYDSSPGVVSMITVTNTANSPGDVLVQWVYVDGTSCLEFNRNELLTPNDTLTVIAGVHNPQGGAGYLYVYALDAATNEPISHNYLIGHASLVNGLTMGNHAADPRAFACFSGDVNGNGKRDLDGLEYEQIEDQVLVPRFLAQGRGFDSYLVLVDLTGGSAATTTLDFLIYNDNEEVFSSEYTFNCWDRVALPDISGLFTNGFLRTTGHDPLEIVGLSTQESGWMRIDGAITTNGFTVESDPAFVAMLVDSGASGSAGMPLAGIGIQDNGSLIPQLVSFPDCNNNGISDKLDIANGHSADCDNDGVPDECQPDCDGDGIPDVCEADCNANGIPDDCENLPDCNGDGVPDECEPDADGDGIPDDCDLECDNNVVVELWSPNHQYQSVDLAALIDALPHSALSADLVITSITQDEPLDAGGGGPNAAVCDGYGIGGSIATLRSERLGGGNGRVYEVGFTATGPFGQTCAGSILVTVPHSQNGQPAVDDGQLYDSTQNCP